MPGRAKYGVSNPGADDDGDGATNLAEYQAGTHPRLSNTWTLPEGATGFFAERIALANPDSTPADVTLTFLRPAPSTPITRTYSLLPYGRTTVDVNAVAGLGQADVSTVITANTGGVVAERTMFWGDQFYGGHTGKAIERTGTTWYLAEGAANSFFTTFVLLANPGSTPATATVTFLLEPSGTVTKSYSVPANSRVTIYTNEVQDAGGGRPLNGRSFSTQVTSDRADRRRAVDVLHQRARVERRPRSGGGARAADELVRRRGRDRQLLQHVPAARQPQRLADHRDDPLPAAGRPGRDADAEPGRAEPHDDQRQRRRAQHRRVDGRVGAAADHRRARHVLARRQLERGARQRRHRLDRHDVGLAEGELGGSRGFQTYVLIANPTANAASVRLRFLVENGTSFVTPTFNVPANSRVTRSAAEFMAAGQLTDGARFGVVVESMNGVPLAVEHAIYWNGGGEFWGGGSNETGVRIR